MKSLIKSAGLAGLLASSVALAAGNAPNTNPSLPSKPVNPAAGASLPALPGVIKGVTYKYVGSQLNITVQGSSGDAPCGLIIQRSPVSSWDPGLPGQQGVVAVVGKGERLQLPLTLAYGQGTAPKETLTFSVKGLATRGVPACQGSAVTDYVFAPPPPPEVNS